MMDFPTQGRRRTEILTDMINFFFYKYIYYCFKFQIIIQKREPVGHYTLRGSIYGVPIFKSFWPYFLHL